MNLNKRIAALAASLMSFISFSAAQEVFSDATGDPLGFFTRYLDTTLATAQQQPTEFVGNMAAFAFIWLFNYMIIYIPVRVAKERLEENNRSGSDALIDFMNALTGHGHSRGIRGEKEDGHRNYLLILTFLGTASMYGAGLGPTIQSVQTWFVFFDNIWFVLIAMVLILLTLAIIIAVLFGYDGRSGVIPFLISVIPGINSAAEGAGAAGSQIKAEASRRGKNALDDLLTADNEIDQAWQLYKEFKRKRGQDDFNEDEKAREIAGLLQTGVEDLLRAEDELERVLEDDLERVEKDISELKNDLKLDNEEVSELETLESHIRHIEDQAEQILNSGSGYAALKAQLEAGALQKEWQESESIASTIEGTIESETSVESALEDLSKDIKALKMFKKIDDEHGQQLKRAKKMEANLPNYLDGAIKNEVESKINAPDRKAREVWLKIEEESEKFEQLIERAEKLVGQKLTVDRNLVDQMTSVTEHIELIISHLSDYGHSGKQIEEDVRDIMKELDASITMKENEIDMMESLLEDT